MIYWTDFENSFFPRKIISSTIRTLYSFSAHVLWRMRMTPKVAVNILRVNKVWIDTWLSKSPSSLFCQGWWYNDVFISFNKNTWINAKSTIGSSITFLNHKFTPFRLQMDWIYIQMGYHWLWATTPINSFSAN